MEVHWRAKGPGPGRLGFGLGPRVLGRTLLVPPGLGGVEGGWVGGEGHESGWGGAKGPRPDPLGFRPFRPGWGGGVGGDTLNKLDSIRMLI